MSLTSISISESDLSCPRSISIPPENTPALQIEVNNYKVLSKQDESNIYKWHIEDIDNNPCELLSEIFGVSEDTIKKIISDKNKESFSVSEQYHAQDERLLTTQHIKPQFDSFKRDATCDVKAHKPRKVLTEAIKKMVMPDLGKMPDADLAKIAGVSYSTIQKLRRDEVIDSYQSSYIYKEQYRQKHHRHREHRPAIKLTLSQEAHVKKHLGHKPDGELASEVGLTRTAILRRRNKALIDPFPSVQKNAKFVVHDS